MYVQDQTGCHWGSLTIYGRAQRCQWCHVEFRGGWASDRFNGSIYVCGVHVVVDWSAAWVEPATPAYRGIGDPVHKSQRRKRRAS